MPFLPIYAVCERFGEYDMKLDRLLDALGFSSSDEKELLVLIVIALVGLWLFCWALKKEPDATHGEITTTVSARRQEDLDAALNEELKKNSAALFDGDMKINQENISVGPAEYKNGNWEKTAKMTWKR